MANPAHTPGPWTAEPADMFGDHNIILADSREDARAIAAVVSNIRDPDEVAANARLIAAAPELLETLTACRDQFDFYAREHRKAEKHDKAATNEKFAFLATQAILKALPVTSREMDRG
jgi:hypothetical protein